MTRGRGREAGIPRRRRPGASRSGAVRLGVSRFSLRLSRRLWRRGARGSPSTSVPPLVDDGSLTSLPPDGPQQSPPAAPSPTAAAAPSSAPPSSTSTGYTRYVGIRVYVAKGHLLFRHGPQESLEHERRGRDVNDSCIHHIYPIPEKVESTFLKRDFDLRNKDMLNDIKGDWYAIVEPKIKDKKKQNMDKDLYYVNGELRKHARFIPQFTTGEQAVRFALDRFRAVGVRNRLRLFGDFNGVPYNDKNGNPWNGLPLSDLEARLLAYFDIRPHLHLFRTRDRIFVHEYVFFFDVETGAWVDPHKVGVPDHSEWLKKLWGELENRLLKDKTLIYV